MKFVSPPVPAELTKRGDVLVGVVPRSDKPRDQKPKTFLRRDWDDELAAHVETMAEGETVKVEVVRHVDGSLARLVGKAPLASVPRDRDRDKVIKDRGGFVNPYTFVPTLPRDDLAGTELGDAPPPSHARHGDRQWSGTLTLTLTTVTPLLLPVLAATQPQDGPKTYDTRVDHEGRPLIHGASFKGALRSAYETVTASRFGVFSDHDQPLAYRLQTNTALELTPARVHRRGDGRAFFRLCRGDKDWALSSQLKNPALYAALVPAYGRSRAVRLGSLSVGPLSQHHGTQVYARVVTGRDGHAQAWRVTHLARTEKELLAKLTEPCRSSAGGGRQRIVRGWLSATGRSIGTKLYERLFVETPDMDVPLTDKHVSFWQSVLRAYELAQDYNDPRDTYQQNSENASTIERSHHVRHRKEVYDLPHGTLVYVKYDRQRNEVTEVHPVMIGRLPFDAAPSRLLHDTLRPAQHRDQLSPADRLFGWVPTGQRDDDGDTNDGASGYRGRLRVRSITCLTKDWRPASFPPEGVTLAPLSSPKPTQFRFYAARDQTSGMPVQRSAKRSDGYSADGGLRGRKMYRWREEHPEHWQPKVDRQDEKRGYLALDSQRGRPKQVVRHRSWVRPGVTFQVELFLDGVPEPELGALLWLLSRADADALSNAAPLRLGAGKPYGFGVMTARIDPDRTRLWDGAGVRAGWLRLTRPDPVSPERLTELAEQFYTTATGNRVLREATESYLAAAAPVTEPVHYPRTSPTPQAENYEWFVANDKPPGKGNRDEVTNGWALPHVRDPEQRLPYLGAESNGDRAAGGSGGRRRPSTSSSQPVPGQRGRPAAGQSDSGARRRQRHSS